MITLVLICELFSEICVVSLILPELNQLLWRYGINEFSDITFMMSNFSFFFLLLQDKQQEVFDLQSLVVWNAIFQEPIIESGISALKIAIENVALDFEHLRW